MKRTLTLILLTLLAATGLYAADPAKMLADAAAKIAEAPSVSAKFTMQTGRGQDLGNMLMAGKACKITAGGVTMWFDGTTQWVYSVDTQEVNITTPTTDELIETNPFMLISGYAKNFNVASAGASKVDLTPKNAARSDIQKATIRFGSDGLPDRIEVHFRNGGAVVATISKIEIGKSLPASTFRFNPAAYPETDVIDLR